ncbi:MAG: PhzF family phenazine biosynthesis protein [Ignavibacteriae bacterium]|nr:MAG: PhzF family phenazine biosynthesis protein [Ignavibacteriota bacterium]
MKTYRIKIVDAFTKKQFAGNPAGVVLDANGLSDSQMQLIGRELNLSETAFILPATEPGANLRIRWFTPIGEVALCGHATIASFHALAEEGMEGMRTNGQHYFRLQTRSGILAVRVEKNFYDTTVEFELPTPAFKIKKPLSRKTLHALGITAQEVMKDLPVVTESYLYIPVKRLSIIEKLKPDYTVLASELTKLKVQGVCVFSLETKEKYSAVHSRFFAPHYGINEDPVTGSSNGPLGFYLHKYVLPAGYPVACREMSDGGMEFIGEQGDVIKRPGRVKIRLRLKQQTVEDVSIAGEAVTILDSTLKM